MAKRIKKKEAIAEKKAQKLTKRIKKKQEIGGKRLIKIRAKETKLRGKLDKKFQNNLSENP
ncbi:MAG: hypothetical protein Hyperionvirus4_99 [Hyperionvirus sp.]|uniref:Uncharacterized protein n=1 Tax=Hyperionvirus sp. TaxID=2487770 RepID=A0A3G5A9H4_9VIRU|nr:MAG: hypothetical protein Hyperionvirus4_99 [Hyperionvirus sp.]